MTFPGATIKIYQNIRFLAINFFGCQFSVVSFQSLGETVVLQYRILLRSFPCWSPDSQSVMYIEDALGQDGERLVCVSRKPVIHNIQTGKRQVVDTPDDWSIHSACFMGSNNLLISAKGQDGNPDKYEIYRYHLVKGEIVNLTNTPGDDYAMDWISDDVLPVTPQGKKSNMGRAKAVKP